MAFELDYFAEHSLILVRVTGSVSLEENREIGFRLVAVLEEVETKADIFFDLRTIGSFPTSITELRKTSAVIRSPKLGWIILLTGKNPLLKFVATVLIQLQTRAGRMRVFDTLESAITFLQGTQPASNKRFDWFSELRKNLTLISA